ncbi:28741_t:CDS:1, partial [Gigaspora margarita]
MSLKKDEAHDIEKDEIATLKKKTNYTNLTKLQILTMMAPTTN